MKEQVQELSPTDKMIVFLEEASKDELQWRTMSHFMTNSKFWQENMRQSGIDVYRIKETIREIDFERKNK